MRVPRSEGGIGGAIGDRQLMVSLRLVDGFQGRAQIGTRVERDFTVVVEGLELLTEIEGTDHIELVHRRAIVQQLEQLDFGCP